MFVGAKWTFTVTRYPGNSLYTNKGTQGGERAAVLQRHLYCNFIYESAMDQYYLGGSQSKSQWLCVSNF